MDHHIETKISFPLKAVFQSAVHESDNAEIWKVLRTSSKCILDINETNHSGLTALHISVLNKNLDGVKMLLCSGADPDVPDENGYTPLHTASSIGLLQVQTLFINQELILHLCSFLIFFCNSYMYTLRYAKFKRNISYPEFIYNIYTLKLNNIINID